MPGSSEYRNASNYRPEIDGLRAIAVLAVILFHAFPTRVQGGFIGVDVFFVISGYLITRIILNELADGTFSFAQFYIRRIRRIFPALLLMLASCLIAGWLVLISTEFQQLGRHILAASGFVLNFVLWGESGYFDTAADTKPLLHLWSLGIEEQFYLVWPLLAWLIWRQKRATPLVMLLIFTASFALNLKGVKHDAEATFYSPLTRIWELFAGALLTRIPASLDHLFTRPWLREPLALAGLTCLLAGFYLIDRHRAFPGLWAVLPVGGTCLLILAGQQSWLCRLLLGNPLAVGIGLISYPLYLWHWPLLSFAFIIEEIDPTRSVRASLVLLAFPLAYLTYRFVEQPIRHSLPPRMAVGGLAAGMLVVATLGGLVGFNKDWPKTRMDDYFNPEIAKAIGDWDYPGQLTKRQVSGLDIHVNQSSHPEVALFGDSHVEQYGPRVSSLSDAGQARPTAFVTAPGCLPIPNVFEDEHGQCLNFTKRFEQFLAEHPSVHTVVLGAYWAGYFIEQTAREPKPGDHYRYYFKKDKDREEFRGGQGRDKALGSFKQFIRDLRHRYTVYVLLDNPADKRFDPLGMLGQAHWRRSQTFTLHPQTRDFRQQFPAQTEQEALNQEIRMLAEAAGATVLDPAQQVCPAGQCSVLDEQGRPLYKDSNHLRPYFVREKMDFMDSVLRQPSTRIVQGTSNHRDRPAAGEQAISLRN
ncbi:acyltransferase family protein [Parachitinimonas caeni]|uniref:Acyltransferase family protein n=1 Tax=Parachitinimonas caeni TaxID=3031301 RepID=A0ABT7DT91_9NEIS|nr:acyltransferase family protein [Parachitinimonas caeni]MDK2123291.1 acyltransferase family protein [Parachitinimonas caeni]